MLALCHPQILGQYLALYDPELQGRYIDLPLSSLLDNTASSNAASLCIDSSMKLYFNFPFTGLKLLAPGLLVIF